MRNFKFTPMILLFLVIFTSLAPAVSAIDAPEVASNAIVLMETDRRTVLLSQNENVRVYPASTTKIMTVLLAVEAIEDGRASLDDVVTAPDDMDYDLIPDGSSAGIVPGEQMRLQDLLYCAMLASGNDACNVIAEYIGGTIPAFIDMMNDRAEALGCTGTHFANAHGLPNENHYTTAWDFSLIALEAISHSEFMTICDTVTYEVPATNMSDKRELSNTNGLINDSSHLYSGYKYEYAHGVKTGYTSDAGYCLVSTAEKDGIQLLCVVMGGVVNDNNGAMSYSNFTDSRTLYDWGFENFSLQNIITTSDTIATVGVALSADGDTVALRPQNVLTAFLPNDIKMENFEFDVTTTDGDGGEELKAPISAGDILGEATVSLDGVNYGTVKLVAASSVGLSKMSYIKGKLGSLFGNILVKIFILIFIALLVIYIIAVIRYRRRRLRYLRYMKAKQAAARRKRVQAAAAGTKPEEKEPAMTAAPHAAGPQYEKRAADRDYFEEFFKK